MRARHIRWAAPLPGSGGRKCLLHYIRYRSPQRLKGRRQRPIADQADRRDVEMPKHFPFYHLINISDTQFHLNHKYKFIPLKNLVNKLQTSNVFSWHSDTLLPDLYVLSHIQLKKKIKKKEIILLSLLQQKYPKIQTSNIWLLHNANMRRFSLTLCNKLHTKTINT